MRALMIKILVALVSFVATMTVLIPQALAEIPGKTVSSIQVSGLGNYRGNFITAIYARGGPSSLAAPEKQFLINLRQIRLQKTLEITADTVTFPATTTLTWTGLQFPYDYVVFVIHQNNDSVFKWANPNGTFPEGSPDGYATPMIKVDFLTKAQIETLPNAPGDKSVLQYFFKFD